MASAGEHVLFGSRGSGSAAAELGLRACGLPYRLVRASSWEEDSAIEELGKVNPLRQIPTLVLPDGTVMSESAAILIHLALACPDAHLLPRDASDRALALRGLVFIAANCYSAISVSDYPERWTRASDDDAREKVRSAARGQLHRNWEIFADMFANRTASAQFLSGEQPGAVDFLAAVVSRWSGTRQHLCEHRPDFLALLERIDSHECVAPVIQQHWET